MSKKKVATVRLRLAPGLARTGPPISTWLAPFGIDIAKFCSMFNEESLSITNSEIDLEVAIKINTSSKKFSFQIKGISIIHLLEVIYESNEEFGLTLLDLYKIVKIQKQFSSLDERLLFKNILNAYRAHHDFILL